MSSLETPVPRPKGRAKNLLGRVGAIEDGTILKTVFLAMLAGAAWVLASDYFELNATQPDDLLVAPGDPMLPAVERPEIDPDNPAYRPLEHIRTPPEQLAEPLSIELLGGGVLMLSGTIVPGAATRFAQEVDRRGDYVETVALNSPGGSVEDALAIGRLIRESGFDTAVGDGALCGSSCPLVLAGGIQRIVSDKAAIGVHQIYAGAGGEAIGSAQAMSDAQSVSARIARYLEEMGIDPLIWINAMETPPDRLYFLTLDEMEQTRLAALSADNS
ncbi:ATP-dependent Clp protease proteolytic subunit [Pelagibacterium sp.]|uniref:ATP-dependent Clp protease proteolytic subunit n=1 Tax=Pelagibacterium sp. TaxID=1967288 RepID=UPI003A91F0F6